MFQSAVSRAESSGVQWAEVTPIHVRYIYTEFTLYRVILSSVASAGWCGGAQPAGLHHPGLHSLGVSLNATAPTQSSLQSQPSTKQLTCCQHSTLTQHAFLLCRITKFFTLIHYLLRAPRQCPTLSNFKSFSRFSVSNLLQILCIYHSIKMGEL